MRCPFCETVWDDNLDKTYTGVDSEPVEVAQEIETCLVKKVVDIYDGSDSYEWVDDLTEYQCRDCGRSFWV